MKTRFIKSVSALFAGFALAACGASADGAGTESPAPSASGSGGAPTQPGAGNGTPGQDSGLGDGTPGQDSGASPSGALHVVIAANARVEQDALPISGYSVKVTRPDLTSTTVDAPANTLGNADFSSAGTPGYNQGTPTVANLSPSAAGVYKFYCAYGAPIHADGDAPGVAPRVLSSTKEFTLATGKAYAVVATGSASTRLNSSGVLSGGADCKISLVELDMVDSSASRIKVIMDSMTQNVGPRTVKVGNTAVATVDPSNLVSEWKFIPNDVVEMPVPISISPSNLRTAPIDLRGNHVYLIDRNLLLRIDAGAFSAKRAYYVNR